MWDPEAKAVAAGLVAKVAAAVPTTSANLLLKNDFLALPFYVGDLPSDH